MKVSTVGIDLAKNVFQLHGVNELGKTVFKKQLRREKMAEFFVNLPACLIGMEACSGAHYWARKLQGFDHTVKLMPPQFVKPYVKTNKNDAADAEAICEAVVYGRDAVAEAHHMAQRNYRPGYEMNNFPGQPNCPSDNSGMGPVALRRQLPLRLPMKHQCNPMCSPEY